MKRSVAKAALAIPALNSGHGHGEAEEAGAGLDTRPLIQGFDLSAGYADRAVLHNINIAVRRGEFVGLLGPNGSGKSTLLHTLTGYSRASGGKVEVEGCALNSLSRRQIAASIAFVPQKTESTFVFNSLDMVMMGRHPFAGLSAADSADDIERAMAALDELHILPLAHRPFANLSGGEQQLVLLARSFAQGAPLLILDEPLTGLDIRHQFQLMSALRRRTDIGRNGALATFHDLSAATRWCTRLIVLSAGRLVSEGSPAQAITPQILERVYGVSATVTPTVDGHGFSIFINDSSGALS